MPIKSVDVQKLGAEMDAGGIRLLNGPHFQMWVTTWAHGRKGRLHCHNCDETLYVIEGELTLYELDGTRHVLQPGMATMITGGSFYRLENSGPGKVIYLGHNPKPTETMRTIEHETRRDHDPDWREAPEPRVTSFLS